MTVLIPTETYIAISLNEKPENIPATTGSVINTIPGLTFVANRTTVMQIIKTNPTIPDMSIFIPLMLKNP